MTITLTPEMKAIVEQKIQSGQYASADEVVLEGLRLLDEHVNRLQELRAEIAVGIEQADQGLLAAFDPMKTLDRVLQRKNLPDPGDE